MEHPKDEFKPITGHNTGEEGDVWAFVRLNGKSRFSFSQHVIHV